VPQQRSSDSNQRLLSYSTDLYPTNLELIVICLGNIICKLTIKRNHFVHPSLKHLSPFFISFLWILVLRLNRSHFICFPRLKEIECHSVPPPRFFLFVPVNLQGVSTPVVSSSRFEGRMKGNEFFLLSLLRHGRRTSVLYYRPLGAMRMHSSIR